MKIAKLLLLITTPVGVLGDKKGRILHCGSFSKCLAPGYRLGWIVAGRFTHGSYESHLMRSRGLLAKQQAAALESLRRHFPPGYQVSPPRGGYFLWIACAASVDSLNVHRLALDAGISIAPETMFSARRQFANFIRLNCVHPWSARMDRAIQRLGEILRHA